MNKKKLFEKWSSPNKMGLCVGSLSITDLQKIIIDSNDKDVKQRCLDMLGCLSEFIHECRPYLEHGDYTLSVCIKRLRDSL